MWNQAELRDLGTDAVHNLGNPGAQSYALGRSDVGLGELTLDQSWKRFLE